MLVLTKPTGTAPGDHRRCRYLTVAGLPCQQRPLKGEDFCYQHGKHRHPICPSGLKVVVPLIENTETVQLVSTQVTQGLFAGTLDPWRAGKILYALQVAAMTFPRPARLQPVKAEPVEPVTEVFESTDGELLGPAEIPPAAPARFDSVWSWDKFRYEQECEALGQPPPKTPADMPESGWLNDEELDDVSEQANRGEVLIDAGHKDKMLELRLDADRRGILPPLADRKCSYGEESWCRGPNAQGPWQSACDRCTRERDEYCRLHPDQPKPTCSSDAPTDLKAVAEAPQPLLSKLSTPLTASTYFPHLLIIRERRNTARTRQRGYLAGYELWFYWRRNRSQPLTRIRNEIIEDIRALRRGIRLEVRARGGGDNRDISATPDIAGKFLMRGFYGEDRQCG